MSEQLIAKNIFGRNHFKSYSEFYLALAIGNVLKNRGMSLNMDGMLVDADMIPQNIVTYYKRLLYDGAITISMYSKGKEPDNEINTNIDTSYFDSINLVEDKGTYLDWSIEFANNNYGEYKKQFLELIRLGNTLVHLVAHHLVKHFLDGENRKLVIHFDYHKAKSSFLYVNIYSVLQTIIWLKDFIELDVDFGDYGVDLDYSIHCNNGKVAGRYKLFPVAKKLELFKKYGMVEGSILVLWERDGMCESNEYGRISGAKIFRLEEIGDDYIGVTFISLNKTKEEVYQDYYDIEESKRGIFTDMLNKKPYMAPAELSICGLGVDNYFYNEDKYVTLLDESEEVYKLVTIDGKVVSVKMRAVDAIYWLLCQYEIEFDKDLYKSMYFGDGEEPLWDKYN